MKPYLECWILLDDNEPTEHEEECGVGKIYGVHYGNINAMFSDLFVYMQDTIRDYKGEIPDNAFSATFRASEFSHQEGQVSFPETGQWDFPPYWEISMVLTGFDTESPNDPHGDPVWQGCVEENTK